VSLQHPRILADLMRQGTPTDEAVRKKVQIVADRVGDASLR
jgi:hypothetical protein